MFVGNKGGVEAYIHSLKEIFGDEKTEGIIQVDDDDAFKRINWKEQHNPSKIICYWRRYDTR